MKRLFGALLLLCSFCASADVAILYNNNLPYEFSESNYDNSPSNYTNSLSNYENSSSNYANSSSNYDNSRSNYDNSINGGHRLYYRQGGVHMTWAGYYVPRDQGYVNFFSPGGERMFFKPAEHSGVFSADDGTFCGVYVMSQGSLALILTSKGTEKFAKLNQQ